MTFSALISGTIPHCGKYGARPGKVTRVIQHHWASVTMSGEAALASPTAKKSVTYVIHNDGIILGQVPEEYRPWTSGGSAADNPSITLEVQNQSGAPEWRVSAEAEASIVRLLADVAVRHGFGAITSQNYCGHREFAATACPGPYLFPRLQVIRDAVNAGSTPTPAPAPAPAPGPRRTADGNLWLDEDGDLGPKTIARWQQIMGTPIDGVISRPKSSLIGAVQRTIIARGHSCGRWGADQSFGPATIGALQDELGTPRDGVISHPYSSMVKALQVRLNACHF